MGDVGIGIKRVIQDVDGEAATVTGNRLDVNAYLSATPTIDIGDVSLLLGGTAADTGLGTYGAQTLRVTMAADDALLSAMNTNLADIETLLTTIDSDTGTISTYAEAIFTDMDALSKSTGNVATTAGHKGIGALAVRNDVAEAWSGIADGDYTFLQASSIGALYVTGAEVENAAVQSQPSLIGGRYDSSARTLGDGDAGAVALNASGHMLMDVVDGGQLDTIIDTLETTLTAIETDQAALEVLSTAANVDLAAMEALLITIDSDTDAIKTAVQILDDWDDSNYANVNINIAGTDVDGNSGNKSAQSQRVVIATDDVNVSAIKTAVEILDNAISGSEMQVDVVAALPAGDNNIGNVDIASSVALTVDCNSSDVTVDNLASWLTATTGAVTSPGHAATESYGAADTGLGILAVCNDVLSALASVTDGEYAQLQVDTQGALYTTHGMTGMFHDKNLAVGTSAEVLKTSTACKRVDMMASWDNTGYIHVGSSGVTTALGIRLAAGDFYSIDVNNTADIYVIATVADEDIHFIYYT